MTQAHQATLLVELLTEELPPKALARLSDAFAESLVERLAARDLIAGEPSFERFATPRRLAVVVHNVRVLAPEKQVREKVLPVSVALDANGQPTAPLAKKLAALGFPDVPLADLERKGSAGYLAEVPMHDDAGTLVTTGRVTIKLLSHNWKRS